MRPHELLEKEWAEFNGLDPENMVACASGTAALHLAFESVRDVGGGPALPVYLPDYAMIAGARAAVMAGFTYLRSVDVLSGSLGMDVSQIPTDRDWIRPGATLLVHNYGRAQRYLQMPTRYVIEDLAEAHGIRPETGSWAATWSFYSNKIVAGEEGGAVWFRERDAARYARKRRNLGFNEPPDYSHAPRGCNYRLADSLATRIRVSLEDYPDNLWRRRELEAAWDFTCSALIERFGPPDPREAPWVYDIRVPSTAVEPLVRGLREAGVPARHGFKPLVSQAEFSDIPILYDTRRDVTVSLETSRTRIYLPLTPGFLDTLTLKQSNKVADLLQEAAAARDEFFSGY